ncbi:MAG: hypothetical protein CSA66_04215 [Proteobacteria bacterium]|nr:MAG: hypothetical protein CSA66_04215 [Pseudomonadota bacterium]
MKAPLRRALTLAQYETLVKAAKERSGPQPTWATGRATVDLPGADGQFVSVSVEADVAVVGEEGVAEVLLLPGNVVLEAASFDGADATLLMRGGAHVALLPADDDDRKTVRLRYRVPTQPSTDGASLAVLPLPPLPGASLEVRGGRAPGPVEVWPTGSARVTGDTLSVQLPATPAAVLRWGAAVDALRRVELAVALAPGSDGAAITGRFEVVIEGRRALVKLAPISVALTEVVEGGKPVRTRVVGGWHQAVVTGAGRHVITARFRTGIDRGQGQPVVALTLPQAPITRVEAKIPGKRAVTFDPKVPVDVAVAGEGDDAVTTAAGFLPPTDRVAIRWTEPRSAPEKVVSANSETYQLVRLDEGVLRSKVEIRYEIIRGSIEELAIQLPDDPGVVLYKVSGDGIEDWRTFAATDDAPRQARVFLGNAREGSYRLTLELEQVVPTKFGAKVAVPLVRPLDVTRERGVVALFDGDKVAFAPATSGNGKAGEDALPVDIRQHLGGDIVNQAFKHIGAPKPIASEIEEAKERDFGFDARVESLYLFQQNALEVRAIVAIDVKSGKTDEITLSLPRGLELTGEVNAPSLKEAEWIDDAEGDEAAARRRYRVSLTQALGGHFSIELTLSQTLATEVTELALPDVRVEGAKVEKGVFGIASEGMMEVSQREATRLTKVDVAQLPRSITLQTKRDIELGYTYSFAREDHAPSLTLGLERHKTVETLTASIASIRLETTVFAEGDVVTRATFAVDNRERNFVRLALPEGAKVLGAAVDGLTTEPIADEATAIKIRVPKQRRCQIELVYKLRRDELGFLPSLALVAPRPDVFAQDFEWLVRVPARFSIYGTDTELHEVAASRWSPPDRLATIGVDVQPSGEVSERLFRLDVYDAPEREAALSVDLSLVSTPGPGLDIVLFLLALLLLALAAWRRALGSAGAGSRRSRCRPAAARATPSPKPWPPARSRGHPPQRNPNPTTWPWPTARRPRRRPRERGGRAAPAAPRTGPATG